MNAGPLIRAMDLDSRAREVFREIVESFLSDGEPVGSRTLSRRGIALSPASIRNTMSDLAALGLLNAPHSSAGRLPTQAGLRLFVDGLLEIGDLGSEEQRDIEARLAGGGNSLPKMLAAASEMLSGLAGGASIVMTPTHEAPVKHVEFVSISPEQALIVLVSDDGAVENRLMRSPPGLTPAAMQEASNYLNAHMKGKTWTEARHEIAETLTRDRMELDVAAAGLIEAGAGEWSGEDPARGRSLIVRGRANLLADTHLAADLARVKQLFEDLERNETVMQMLDLAREADGVRIFIGAENPLFSLSGSSLIVAPYMNAERKVVGALGVIGPTRLNYARVIPVVDYTSRLIGRLLGGEYSSKA